MNIITVQTFKTPYGELLMGAFEGQLCLCDWRYRRMRGQIDQRIQRQLQADYAEGSDPLFANVQRQLNEYLQRERTVFELPLLPVGTTFQQKVWKALIAIPYGETRTYGQLSEETASVSSVRAVASANGANALSIIVPCHRVIGARGDLVGYAGGLRVKRQLLDLEHDLFRK